MRLLVWKTAATEHRHVQEVRSQLDDVAALQHDDTLLVEARCSSTSHNTNSESRRARLAVMAAQARTRLLPLLEADLALQIAQQAVYEVIRGAQATDESGDGGDISLFRDLLICFGFGWA